MLYSLYSVRDVHTGYSVPIVDVNDASAMRAFAHEVMNESSLWHTHKADYSLYRVGSFDTTTGTVLDEEPTVICNATDF